MTETAQTTAADAIAAAFARAGTRRIYGVPGGGSSLDLIAAAKACGVDFVLARHETSAVIMAATEAELSGTTRTFLSRNSCIGAIKVIAAITRRTACVSVVIPRPGSSVASP